jgi:hypothetical protein
MQVKKSKRKKVIIIILLLVVIVALLHTKFAVRCMLVGRLSWEIAFSHDNDVDYVSEKNSDLVFTNKNSLIWLRKQAWEAQIELIPIGTQLKTSPVPSYYVGNTFIGDDGRLSYRFLITTYHFYIEGSKILTEYASDCLVNGSMLGIN